MTIEDKLFILFCIFTVISIGVGMWYGDRQPSRRGK